MNFLNIILTKLIDFIPQHILYNIISILSPKTLSKIISLLPNSILIKFIYTLQPNTLIKIIKLYLK